MGFRLFKRKEGAQERKTPIARFKEFLARKRSRAQTPLPEAKGQQRKKVQGAYSRLGTQKAAIRRAFLDLRTDDAKLVHETLVNRGMNVRLSYILRNKKDLQKEGFMESKGIKRDVLSEGGITSAEVKQGLRMHVFGDAQLPRGLEKKSDAINDKIREHAHLRDAYRIHLELAKEGFHGVPEPYIRSMMPPRAQRPYASDAQLRREKENAAIRTAILDHMTQRKSVSVDVGTVKEMLNRDHDVRVKDMRIRQVLDAMRRNNQIPKWNELKAPGLPFRPKKLRFTES